MKIDSKRQVLVLGATGTVGSAVARATVLAGGDVRALVRSEASVAKLPAGVTAMRGDLRDANALKSAMRGVQAVFYVSPHEPDEEALAASVIRACNDAKVRLVFVGVHVDATT
ncbi:MAG: NAD(P)H-binding protein, partial [Polyangiaceae bacterium]